jgi:formate hydrogenlyase subunit 3/multisubunit Na+/H+ antiporter MnhD subunit
MDFILIGIAFILVGSLAALAAPAPLKSRTSALLSAAGYLAVIAASLDLLLRGATESRTFAGGPLFGSVPLVLDPLAAFFTLAVALTCLLGTVYGTGYLHAAPDDPPAGPERQGGHFFCLALLGASMLLVTAVQHALVFLILWETMTLASFFLVVTEHWKDEVVDAGINYLVSMHVGVVCLVVGFLALTERAGGLDFRLFAAAFQSPGFPAAGMFLLFFAGFGIKAGFVPLQTWLPRAHPAAPSHVSGIMSGIMIKTGIYGILRVVSWLGKPPAELAFAVLAVAAASAVLGVVYAIAQHDLKRLLAYHSVENIGIIGLGIGMGLLGLAYNAPMIATLGFAGAILHVLNHSIFKALLFYAAGAICRRLHTRDLERMGGLARPMPATAGLFIAGSAAICGLPPFNGFVSEFLVYAAAFSGLVGQRVSLVLVSALVMAVLALVGVLALICFAKVCGVALLGLPRQPQPPGVRDPGWSMRGPMAVLGALALLIGVLPQAAAGLALPAARLLAGTQALPARLPVLDLLQRVSILTVALIALAAGLLALRRLLLGGRPVETFRTWDCGYGAGTPRMQYTASSFAAPVLALTNPVLALETSLEKPAGFFPVRASFRTHPGNIFEAWLIQPVVSRLNRFLERFTWIQSGSTQRYIFYGLVFLAVTLAWMAVVP